MTDTTDTCPDCGAPRSERVDVSRHWKCGSRPVASAGDAPARRSWACEEIVRRERAMAARIDHGVRVELDKLEAEGREVPINSALRILAAVKWSAQEGSDVG